MPDGFNESLTIIGEAGLMESHTITIKLTATMVAALRELAVREDVSVGQIVRQALERDIQRRVAAKTPVRADERLVVPLRALLADDFAFALSWADLAKRLAAKGYALAEAGGGLVLIDCKTGERQCKGSELGYGYSQLLRKFDLPFPNHRHHWLLTKQRLQSQAASH